MTCSALRRLEAEPETDVLAITAREFYTLARHRLWMATGFELPDAQVLVVAIGIVAISSFAVGMTLKLILTQRDRAGIE